MRVCLIKSSLKAYVECNHQDTIRSGFGLAGKVMVNAKLLIHPNAVLKRTNHEGSFDKIHLKAFPNLNAPACAPNLYLPVPGRSAWLEKPLMLESLEFRRCLQILENGDDLAPDQAIALQAQSAIKSDQRLTETRDFLSGAAAALATVQLRDPSLRASYLLLLVRFLCFVGVYWQCFADGSSTRYGFKTGEVLHFFRKGRRGGRY